MQIKATTKSGQAILYTPRELVRAAVLYAVKLQNTSKKIWWAMEKSINVVNFSCKDVPHTSKKQAKKFNAHAIGTVDIGYTDVKTDRFFTPRPYTFEVEYVSARDNIGLPDIKITKAVMVPIQKNQSKHVAYEELVATKEKLVAHAKEFKADKVKKSAETAAAAKSE
jgi:hypothetical protein